jgi:hypothetical protein
VTSWDEGLHLANIPLTITMSGDTTKTVLGIRLSGFRVLNGMRSLQNGRNALADVHDIRSSARTIVRGLSLSQPRAHTSHGRKSMLPIL